MRDNILRSRAEERGIVFAAVGLVCGPHYEASNAKRGDLADLAVDEILGMG